MDFINFALQSICSCLPSLAPSTTQILQLGTRSLKVIRLLGEGGFSYVYLVSDSATSNFYALKKIRCPFGEESIRTAMKEINAYKLFRHRSIIRAIDHAVLQDRDGSKVVYILLPYYKNGNLQDIINENNAKSSKITSERIKSLARGILMALLQLHEFGISEASEIAQDELSSNRDESDPLMQEDDQAHTADNLGPYAHLDLKPANVMLDDDGKPVLMDFGSCRPARRLISTRSEALVVQDEAAEQSTMPYRAPELFDCPTNSTIDEKVDIWSFGCLLFALMYGNSPFETSQTESGSIALAVLNCQFTFPTQTPAAAEQHLQNIILSCLAPKAFARPTARELLDRLEHNVSLARDNAEVQSH